MATESDVDEYNTRDFVDTEITGLTEDLEDVLDQIPGYTSSLGLPVTATYSDGHTEGEVFLGPLIGERSVKFLDRQMKENRFSKEASKSYNIPSIASFTRKVAEAEGEEVLPTIEFTNVEGYPRSVPSASMAYLPEEDRLVNASYGTVQELAMEDEMFKGGYKEDNQPIIRPIKINVKNIGNQLEDRQNIEDPDLNMFQ